MEIIKHFIMEKNILKSLLVVMTVSLTTLFTACTSNNQPDNPAAAQDTAAKGSNLMQEGPAYDATKIDPNAAVTEITLKTTGNTMTEMKYDQTDLHVKAGSTVKLKLINEAKDAAMQHNFILIQPGSADKVAAEGLKAGPDMNYTAKMSDVLIGTKVVGPGQQTEISFPAPAKGTYDFICTYPGHYKMMNGKLTVE
jgi:azurin